MIKQKLSSAKNYVVAHKTTILVCALVVTTTAVATQQVGINQHNDYLKEKNLYEDYYALDEE
jgi:cell division protein FtsL